VRREHEEATRLKHPVDFFQRLDSVVVNNVVNGIKGKQDEVKSFIAKRAKVSRVAAENGGGGIFSLDNLNTLRRVIDSRVVFAYFRVRILWSGRRLYRCPEASCL
jgi:hypothetical protein